MNEQCGKAAKFFWIIITSITSTALILIVTAVIFSISAVFIASDKLENVTQISIPEPEKENSSYIYCINSTTNEYDLVYKVTPYTGNIKIETDASSLPEYVKGAFISIEDERFYSHDGIDIKMTTLAVIKEILRSTGFMNSEVTGGSTITQQLVKNITSDNELSIDRKLREISRAVTLETNYTKEQILEKYLNIIYFGQTEHGYNMYGIEAASIGYFGKTASELTIAEAACLAAIPQNPHMRNPLLNPEENSERRLYCLRKMFQLGYISADEYENAKRSRLSFVSPENLSGKLDIAECTIDFINPEPTPWYVDTALSEFCDYICELKSLSREDGMKEFMNGGYELFLTIDDRVQAELEKNFSDHTFFPQETAVYTDENGNITEEQVEAAAIVMDYKGSIKGIIGGIGQKPGSFCWNNATDAHRQPGSTIKPVSTYGYALENNFISWSHFFTDSPLPAGVADASEWPKNYNGITSGERLPVYTLLAESYNTTPAQICSMLGIQNIFDFSTQKMKLGLNPDTDLTYAAMSIGATGSGPSLMNLANAYMPFGNGGVYYEAHILSRIKDSSSSRVYLENSTIKGEQVIGEDTAYIMNKLLREVVLNGTGEKALLKNKQNAGKTGTTENYRDILFVGLTEDFVSAVWTGYENAENPYALRYASSAQIWKNVFGNFADSFVSDAVFPECSSVIYTEYCSETGLPASKKCIPGGKGYYKSGNIEYCSKKHKMPETEVSPSYSTN